MEHCRALRRASSSADPPWATISKAFVTRRRSSCLVHHWIVSSDGCRCHKISDKIWQAWTVRDSQWVQCMSTVRVQSEYSHTLVTAVRYWMNFCEDMILPKVPFRSLGWCWQRLKSRHQPFAGIAWGQGGLAKQDLSSGQFRLHSVPFQAKVVREGQGGGGGGTSPAESKPSKKESKSSKKTSKDVPWLLFVRDKTYWIPTP